MFFASEDLRFTSELVEKVMTLRQGKIMYFDLDSSEGNRLDMKVKFNRFERIAGILYWPQWVCWFFTIGVAIKKGWFTPQK